jgi:hypothetical protein
MTKKINEASEISAVSPKFAPATLEIRKTEVNFYSNKHLFKMKFGKKCFL